MPHAIEHPESIGPQNKHILDTLTDAYRVSLDLAEKGFTVLQVSVENRNPKIVIQECGRCRSLHGSRYAWRNGPAGREQVMVKIIHGAQVEWVERG